LTSRTVFNFFSILAQITNLQAALYKLKIERSCAKDEISSEHDKVKLLGTTGYYNNYQLIAFRNNGKTKGSHKQGCCSGGK